MLLNIINILKAEGLVLTLRDLFQVVFEMKKREMEEAKRRKESTEKSPQDSSLVTKNTSNEQTADNIANVRVSYFLSVVIAYSNLCSSYSNNLLSWFN